MILVLVPVLGRFTEDFSAEDIAFAGDLKGTKVKKARMEEGGCCEIIVEADKAVMEAENGYSCFGTIVLRDGSMTGPDGTTYGEVLSATREFSADSVGRDLSENDISSIKNIVDGFGNTTAKTFFSVMGYAGTAFSIGSTVLGLAGVIPSEASRHKAVMQKLQEIQNELHKVNETCRYMSGVLDNHTKMLTEMTLDANEKYVGTFDTRLGYMVGVMDSLERDLQDPVNQEKIENVLLRVCEKYNVPQEDVGRDIDEDYMIVPDEDYLEYDSEEDGFAYEEETFDFDELAASGGLFEEDDAVTGAPDAIDLEADAELQGEETEAEEDVLEALAEEAASPEEQAAENAEEQAQAEENAEEQVQAEENAEAQMQAEENAEAQVQTEETAAVEANILLTAAGAGQEETETISVDESESALEAEEILEEETEPASETEVETERELTERERRLFTDELLEEIAKVRLTSTDTVGTKVAKIKAYYLELYGFFNTDNSSNPIVAFCDIHKVTDNFATSSMDEKELYKQNIKYQFTRAMNFLVALDSPTSNEVESKALNKRNEIDKKTGRDGWAQVDKIGQAPTDVDGNPYCYLMEDYVRLATPEESSQLLKAIQAHDGSKNEIDITSKSGNHVYMSDFIRRMHGRTLEEELELAGIQNLQVIRNTPYNYKAITNKEELDKEYSSSMKMIPPAAIKWADRVAFPAGITFRFERWGHASQAYRTMNQSPPLAAYQETKQSGTLAVLESSMMEVRQFSFPWTKDFMYVCPEFLRWPDRSMNMITVDEFGAYIEPGYTYVPDGASLKQYFQYYNAWYDRMPLTYFVALNKKSS